MPPRPSHPPAVGTLPGLDLEAGARDRVLAPGAMLLAGRARATAADLIAQIQAITRAAPFRQMITPGGRTMSVAMTNCGPLGWISDSRGYRYTPHDPLTGQPWPAMPDSFLTLAMHTATEAGYPGFTPDACLINRYEPRTRLTLHQDRNEREFGQPIVSISLGLPAVFLWGGPTRTDPVRRVPLAHGDIVVWGGPARLAHHGIHPLAEGTHALTGHTRLNLTFRRAG